MAEEKSIGTILGELYLEYIKTTNAASMSRVGAPNIAARPIGDEQTALIDFFNSFEPSTPEERQAKAIACLLYTSPSPRDQRGSRMPSSA